MTDNEIIKALHICAEHEPFEGQQYTYCGIPLQLLFKEILAFVNRKQAEIEKLEAENNHFADIGKMYSEIRAEAIKEFAERLKENKIDIDVSYGYGREHYTEAVAVIEIDNLVKEMVGDEG